MNRQRQTKRCLVQVGVSRSGLRRWTGLSGSRAEGLILTNSVMITLFVSRPASTKWRRLARIGTACESPADCKTGMKKPSKTIVATGQSVQVPKALLSEVRDLIQAARDSVSQTVNAGLTTLYWEVGNRIRREVLREKRAGYGQEIVSALSRQLEPEFGRGFGEKSLRHMIRFAESFSDPEIVSALRRELTFGKASSRICMVSGKVTPRSSALHATPLAFTYD